MDRVCPCPCWCFVQLCWTKYLYCLTQKYLMYQINQKYFRCNVSLRGNGLKVLTANSYIPNDTPVIECRGKYMLNSAHLNKVRTSGNTAEIFVIRNKNIWNTEKYFVCRPARTILMCCNIDSVKSWRFLLTGQLMAMTAGRKRLRKYVLLSAKQTYKS